MLVTLVVELFYSKLSMIKNNQSYFLVKLSLDQLHDGQLLNREPTQCFGQSRSYQFFSLETDHRNLVYIDIATSPKVIRWKLRLQEFDFQVIHVPGRTNIIADPL